MKTRYAAFALAAAAVFAVPAFAQSSVTSSTGASVTSGTGTTVTLAAASDRGRGRRAVTVTVPRSPGPNSSASSGTLAPAFAAEASCSDAPSRTAAHARASRALRIEAGAHGKRSEDRMDGCMRSRVARGSRSCADSIRIAAPPRMRRECIAGDLRKVAAPFGFPRHGDRGELTSIKYRIGTVSENRFRTARKPRRIHGAER